MLRVLAVTNAKYANVNTPEDVNADVAVHIIKELTDEDVFAAESLETLLMVVILEGGESTVMAVSHLSCYRPNLGVVSPWTGQGFGFLGEVEEGQLPPLVKMPDTMLLPQALALKEVLVPTWAKWNAHFGIDAREVRIRGKELMKVEGGKGAGRRVKVAKLQYTPHLFLWRDHARASHEVYTTIDTSAGDRESEGGRGTPKEVVCGVLRAQRHRRQSAPAQQNCIAWVSPAGALDRTLVRWSARKMSPYVSVASPTMAIMFPPMMAGHGGCCRCPAREDKGIVRAVAGEIRSESSYHLCCHADLGEDGSEGGGGLAASGSFFAPDPVDWDPVKVYVST